MKSLIERHFIKSTQPLRHLRKTSVAGKIKFQIWTDFYAFHDVIVIVFVEMFLKIYW